MWKHGLTFPYLQILSRQQGVRSSPVLLPRPVCSNQMNIKCAGGGGDVSGPENSFTSKKKSVITINSKFNFMCHFFLMLFSSVQELWHLCWHIQGGQSNVTFIESYLSSPSCITVCDRMNKNLKWSREEKVCLFSKFDTMSFSLAVCHYQACLAVFAERYTL